MPEIVEYQAIRPGGTVLWSVLAPADAAVTFLREEPGFEIRGEMITRYRVCPDGKWVNTVRYPDGWRSTPEILA